MSNISKAFENGKAFIPFITCGDPDLETTLALAKELERAGAGLIELGIPFSDPTAEGPTIQEANRRALEGGVTTDDIFDMVAELRKTVSVPLVFMTYANVVYSYGADGFPSDGVSAGADGLPARGVRTGADRFLANCEKTGIDGIILPDVPFEEKNEFLPVCDAHGVDLISMIAPTSNDRIAMIAKEAKGFLYCVSSLGVTGVRSEIVTDVGAMVSLARSASGIPCAVGFGISTPAQAARMAGCADGVIVGSAIVKICAEYGRACVRPAAEFARSMAAAVKG